MSTRNQITCDVCGEWVTAELARSKYSDTAETMIFFHAECGRLEAMQAAHDVKLHLMRTEPVYEKVLREHVDGDVRHKAEVFVDGIPTGTSSSGQCGVGEESGTMCSGSCGRRTGWRSVSL